MMKWIKRIFHFLGSIYLAIALICTAAIFVIIGTLIESSTESHLLAAEWTYHSSTFALLLWLFFVNILFAALRRWPFKARHIPFLITHIGLLMIIGGTIVKNRIGLQGHLNVWEGSANQQVILPHTHALYIERKTEDNAVQSGMNLPIEVTDNKALYQPTEFGNLEFKVLNYYSHVKEKMETWIKGSYAYISGHHPIPINLWNSQRPLPDFHQLDLYNNQTQWDLIAAKTEQMQELVRNSYLCNLSICISSKLRPEAFLEKSLNEIINRKIPFDDGFLMISLSISYSAINGFDNPFLEVQWQSHRSKDNETMHISLQGNRSLYNIVQNETWEGTSRFNVDLKRPNPMLLLAEDEHEDLNFIAFDQYGRVHAESFRHANLQSLVDYDQGFGGYAAQARLPYPPFSTGRQDKELVDRKELARQIRQAAAQAVHLAPPLELFKQACTEARVDFADACVEFLSVWQQSDRLLFPEREIKPRLADVISRIRWPSASDKDACHWICLLFDQLEEPIRNGEDLLKFLKQNRWPFSDIVQGQNSAIQPVELLTLLAQQIFSISAQLPPIGIDGETSILQQAKLMSAYLKAYDIDFRILQLPIEEGEESFEKFEWFAAWVPTVLETPLTIRYTPLSPPAKLENRHGCVLLEFRQGTDKERVALTYQPAGLGLKWPILNGQYIVRYQPQTVEIPCRVRLRQARQIHYPHSQQPYSYESDILIARQDETPVEKTLSMNHVHETWDGYRFYLAGMHSAVDGGLKRIQLVVNHDPAKYLLTYPGAIIVVLGIILLFWVQPYRR